MIIGANTIGFGPRIQKSAVQNFKKKIDFLSWIASGSSETSKKAGAGDFENILRRVPLLIFGVGTTEGGTDQLNW